MRNAAERSFWTLRDHPPDLGEGICSVIASRIDRAKRCKKRPDAQFEVPVRSSQIADMTCGCEPTKDLACSLGPEGFRRRLGTIRELTRRALRKRERDGLQLRLAYDAGAETEVRELIGMERQCCGFLDFQMDREDGCFLVTITAPPEAMDSIEQIFSEFAGDALPPTA
jgi:hypothetical protein